MFGLKKRELWGGSRQLMIRPAAKAAAVPFNGFVVLRSSPFCPFCGRCQRRGRLHPPSFTKGKAYCIFSPISVKMAIIGCLNQKGNSGLAISLSIQSNQTPLFYPTTKSRPPGLTREYARFTHIRTFYAHRKTLALARLTTFSGVGGKMTMGMGAVALVD